MFTPGNERFVHHIIVYECTDLGEGEEDVLAGLAAAAGSGCTESGILEHIQTCNHVVVTWALGSEVREAAGGGEGGGWMMLVVFV